MTILSISDCDPASFIPHYCASMREIGLEWSVSCVSKRMFDTYGQYIYIRTVQYLAFYRGGKLAAEGTCN